MLIIFSHRLAFVTFWKYCLYQIQVRSCAGEDHPRANHNDILHLVQLSVTWHTQDSYKPDCQSIR